MRSIQQQDSRRTHEPAHTSRSTSENMARSVIFLGFSPPSRKNKCVLRETPIKRTCMRNVKKPNAYGDNAGPITRLSHFRRSSSLTGRDHIPVESTLSRAHHSTQGKTFSCRQQEPKTHSTLSLTLASTPARGSVHEFIYSIYASYAVSSCPADSAGLQGRVGLYHHFSSSCCRLFRLATAELQQIPSAASCLPHPHPHSLQTSRQIFSVLCARRRAEKLQGHGGGNRTCVRQHCRLL